MSDVLETPPRAWGRRQCGNKTSPCPGNTPTSVGKTAQAWQRQARLQKHPHERGEDPRTLLSKEGREETPPRAWGRPEIRGRNGSLFRNTPTSVGKTTSRVRSRRSSRKHPHERGEDILPCGHRVAHVETPPRAWGRPIFRGKTGHAKRNTPTSVGKTSASALPMMPREKHPHERGEDGAWCASM